MKTIHLEVPDMSCGHCVQAIEGAMVGVPGVERVEVSLDAHRATAVVDSDFDAQALMSAVRDAGYSPSLVSRSDPTP